MPACPCSADVSLPRNPLLITFDDGRRNCLTAALPILESERLPASFFVVTGWMDDSGDGSAEWTDADDLSILSWAEAARVATKPGYEIGSHTASHEWLPACSDDRLAAEIEGAALAIRSHLGMANPALAYPFGGRDARVVEVARTVHDVGFTTDGKPNPREGASPLEVARVLVGDHDSRAALAVRLAGISKARRAGGPPEESEVWKPALR